MGIRYTSMINVFLCCLDTSKLPCFCNSSPQLGLQIGIAHFPFSLTYNLYLKYLYLLDFQVVLSVFFFFLFLFQLSSFSLACRCWIVTPFIFLPIFLSLVDML